MSKSFRLRQPEFGQHICVERYTQITYSSTLIPFSFDRKICVVRHRWCLVIHCQACKIDQEPSNANDLKPTDSRLWTAISLPSEFDYLKSAIAKTNVTGLILHPMQYLYFFCCNYLECWLNNDFFLSVLQHDRPVCCRFGVTIFGQGDHWIIQFHNVPQIEFAAKLRRSDAYIDLATTCNIF